ncbi:MAG: hypothetical protein IIB42_05125 [Candidatus Marinimicrobia bacterium]|nr:hypothetical protein [Candidatus Neomarinimicrobiota bacterium]
MLTALSRLLPMAEKVIDRRSALPILKTICMEGGTARVTDLETTLVMPVPDERSYCLPVALLSKVLKTKPHSLKIVLEEGKINLGYDGSVLTLKGAKVDDFPELPQGKFKPMGLWHRDVFQALAGQAGSCGKDELKAPLLGVHAAIHDGQMTLSATDGHVLRIQNGLDVHKAKPLSGILPTGPLGLLMRLARGHTKVGLSNTHLSFALPGDVTLYVRLIDEVYPDVQSVVPKEFTGEVVLDRDKVLALIKGAKPFADKKTKLSIWEIGSGGGTLKIDNPEEDLSWVAPIPLSQFKGKPIRIAFDLGLFERALHTQQSPLVRWKYVSPDVGTVLKEEGEEWKSGAITVVMPVRIKEEPHEQRSDRLPAAA